MIIQAIRYQYAYVRARYLLFYNLYDYHERVHMRWNKKRERC